MNIKFFIVILITVSFVSSCSKASMGGGLGAGIGAAVGHQIGGKHRPVVTVIGTMLGALVGAEIGHYLDELNKQKIQQSFSEKVNLEWTKDNGMTKVFEPEKIGRNPRGESCGEGTLTEVIPNGQRKKLKVSGCGSDMKAYSI